MANSSQKQRGYTFACESYLSPVDFEKVLRDTSRVKHWAWILHDKDKHEDGTLKEPHYHILLTTAQYKSINVVRKWFYDLGALNTDGNPINTLAQLCVDAPAMIEYFQHLGKPEKHQYPYDDIHFSSISYWNTKCSAKETASDDFVEDLVARELSPVAMARKYGRDYIRNYRSYEEFSQCAWNLENNGAFVNFCTYKQSLEKACEFNKLQFEVDKISAEKHEEMQNYVNHQLQEILKSEWN